MSGLDDRAAEALDAALAAAEVAGAAPSEVALARSTATAAAPGDALVVSSSMPVRDVEWYADRRHGPRVLANRGANGIDGVVSTAVGVALGGPSTWLLIGDLALLHDLGGLLGVGARPVRLRIVVADNGGGGIFSFLPQAAALDASTFERYFGTPAGVDVADALRLHGVPTQVVGRADALSGALGELAAAPGPVAALVVRTLDRQANVALHDTLHAAVARAVDAQLTAAGEADSDEP